MSHVKQSYVKSSSVPTVQIQNVLSFDFLTQTFHCEVFCKEHLAGFDWAFSLCFFFFYSFHKFAVVPTEKSQA